MRKSRSWNNDRDASHLKSLFEDDTPIIEALVNTGGVENDIITLLVTEITARLHTVIDWPTITGLSAGWDIAAGYNADGVRPRNGHGGNRQIRSTTINQRKAVVRPQRDLCRIERERSNRNVKGQMDNLALPKHCGTVERLPNLTIHGDALVR